MQYVIYKTRSSARFRRWLLTGDARASNFIGATDEYAPVINHPIEDKAAIPIVVEEPIYYQGIPTQRLDFGVFFTDMEKAGAVRGVNSRLVYRRSFVMASLKLPLSPIVSL